MGCSLPHTIFMFSAELRENDEIRANQAGEMKEIQVKTPKIMCQKLKLRGDIAVKGGVKIILPKWQNSPLGGNYTLHRCHSNIFHG